jgi:hypothetical protein
MKILRLFSSESMLRVVNGCAERQFPLVPRAVLVCSYDVIGTRCYDYRVTVAEVYLGVTLAGVNTLIVIGLFVVFA